MDYKIHPSEEFAKKLIEYYESIPPLIEKTYLRSISLYAFRIDEDVLCIQDYDIIKLKDDWRMEKGQEVNVKKIRKGMELAIGEIKGGKKTLHFREILNQNTIKKLEVLSQDTGENYSVSVRAKSKFTFQHKYAYVLHLLNQVKLNSDGRKLVYTGSIQPSDYKGIRSAVSIETTKKIIWIRIWSQDKKFSAFAFNGSESVFSPLMKEAERDQKYKVYVWEKIFPEEIIDWDRAKYFTVLAEIAK